jgi:hypothetical protein
MNLRLLFKDKEVLRNIVLSNRTVPLDMLIAATKRTFTLTEGQEDYMKNVRNLNK